MHEKGMHASELRRDTIVFPHSNEAKIIQYAEIIRHNPSFKEAMDFFATTFTKIYEKNFLLARIASEEEQYLIILVIVAAHLSRKPDNPRSGIHFAQVQGIASSHKLASPNRVASLLSLLQRAGYLKAQTDPRDRRMQRMEPTPLALSTLRYFATSYLLPVSMLSGNPGLLGRADDVAFQKRIVTLCYRHFLEFGSPAKTVPAIRVFVSKNAGLQILLRLLTAGFVPGGEADTRYFPFSEISSLFGVSRAHVRRLIEDAEANGLVKVEAEGGRAIRILPAFHQLVETFISAQFGTIMAALEAE